MRSKFLLGLSGSPCTKPSIHAASRDFDLIIPAIIPASSQFLKDLADRVFCLSDHPITGSPDHPIYKWVNPESKGLTRFNPESTHGLTVVNPGSTPGLSGSTHGLVTHPSMRLPQRRMPRTRKLPAPHTPH